MKGTELVLKALRDKGVKYIFGYTGGAIMPIFDEMEKQKCFTFIMSRHEQGAAFMAQGISRASVGTDHPRTIRHQNLIRNFQQALWLGLFLLLQHDGRRPGQAIIREGPQIVPDGL